MSILRIIHVLIKVMEVSFELSDLVVMQLKHVMSYIFYKNLATGLPVA